MLRLDTVGILVRSRLKRRWYEEEIHCRLSPAEECVDMDNMKDAREGVNELRDSQPASPIRPGTSHSDDQLLKWISSRSLSWH